MNAFRSLAGDKSRAVCIVSLHHAYGHQVIISELMWVWLPGMLLWECCGGADDNRMRKLASGNTQLLTTPGGPLRAIFQHDPHSLRRSRAASAAAQSFALRASDAVELTLQSQPLRCRLPARPLQERFRFLLQQAQYSGKFTR